MQVIESIWCCFFSHQDSINASDSDMQNVSVSETDPLLAANGVQRNKEPSVAIATIKPQSVLTLSRLKELIPFIGVFGPLIVFWAIFYQQNSTWILQGTQMDCYLGKLHVPPGTFIGCICISWLYIDLSFCCMYKRTCCNLLEWEVYVAFVLCRSNAQYQWLLSDLDNTSLRLHCLPSFWAYNGLQSQITTQGIVMYKHKTTNMTGLCC